MVEAHATAKYIRTSAQKAGLVLDLIRGRDVNHALATLRFARKGVAKDIEKVLRSAIANAQNKDGFGGDVDRLLKSTQSQALPSSQASSPSPYQTRGRSAPALLRAPFAGPLFLCLPESA